MNTDIRLMISFRDHRKRKRLRMVIGDRATDYLIDLWLTAAQDKPSGILIGWDEIDLALSCGYDGDPAKLKAALIETGWLDVLEDGTFALHGWKEHQGWVVDAPKRQAAAKKNILLRWCLKNIKSKDQTKFKEWYRSEYTYNNGDDTTGILSVYESYLDSNTPSPSPSPSPTNNPLKTYLEKSISNGLYGHSEKIFEFFDYRMGKKKGKERYQTEHGINGLIRDIGSCKDAGYDIGECIDIAMERNWLTPNPKYLERIITNNKPKTPGWL